MAAPNFSPAGGIGSTYTDPQTGTSYTFGNSGWQQISSGVNQQQAPPVIAPTSASTGPTREEFMNSQKALKESLSRPTPAPVTNAPVDIKMPQVETLQQFLDKVMADPKFLAYYNNLLTQAKGDMEQAKSRLLEDYNTGTRLTTKQLSQQTEQTQQDLTASMKSLGIQFPKEQENMLDTLNKRGIALTQEPGQGLKYAQGGRAGYEVSQLSADQQLRKEAVERNANKAIQDIGLQKEKMLGDTATGAKGQYTTEYERGISDTGTKLRDYQQELEQQRQQKAYNIASLKQQEAMSNAQLELQTNIAKKAGQDVNKPTITA